MVFFIIAVPLKDGSDKTAETALINNCMNANGRPVAEFSRINVPFLPYITA